MPTSRPITAAQHARAEFHRRQRKRSYDLLEAARKAKRTYNSEATWAAINSQLRQRSNGEISAWDWQLDIGEALHLGVDVEAINRTGSGKTLPMVLQHFIPGNEKKVTVIISPLNVLEEDQVRKFLIYFQCFHIDLCPVGCSLLKARSDRCSSQRQDL